MPRGPYDTCTVNHILLAEDRKAAGLSQEALVDLGDKAFSLASLKRAESGEVRIRTDLARKIAEALGREDLDYYIIEDVRGSHGAVTDLSGEWRAFYVEGAPTKSPYLVEERLFIQQTGLELRGTYSCLSYERPSDFSMAGKVHSGIAYGTYRVPQRLTDQGFGCFELLLDREDQWLEGYCLWRDYEEHLIDCSKNIWVRLGVHHYEEYIEEVEKIMSEEINISAMRTR